MGQRGEETLGQARQVAPLAARRGQEAILLAKAQGCRVYDADNVAYMDVIGGGGANLLGYGNQYVLDAVRRASSSGLTSGFHTTLEVELSEQLREYFGDFSPWILTASEAEAWEVVLRWCRRATGRQRLVVFDGNRRGAVEAFNVATAGPLGISQPLIAGLAPEVARLTRVVPWGDADTFRAVLDEVGVDVAGVVLDPVAAQFGVIAPHEEFLAAVQEGTRAIGAKLIVDETLTGLRIARGGATEAFGLTPDAVVIGGALGGGISPMGAVGYSEREQVTAADELPPPPPPIGIVAASATVSVLRNDAVHARLEERSEQLAAGIDALAERFGRPLRCNRVGSIFSLYFARLPIVDGNSLARADLETWGRFCRATREAGLLLPSRCPQAAFLSHAHGVKDVEQTLAAMEQALKKLQKEDEA